MEDKPVLSERSDGLQILILNRPERMNALTVEIKNALGELISTFFADPSARCLLISGSGDAFCAGGDLRTLALGHSPDETRERMGLSHVWARQLLTGAKPVIMAVNGAAAGAGFGLALMGDIILASDTAYFYPGFASIGAAADLAVAYTLPRAVGTVRAKQILLANRKVTASEALEMGLVGQLLPAGQLMDEALKLGRKLAAGPTLGLGHTKILVNRAYELPLDEFLAAETAAQVETFASEDCREGASAFLERRTPVFNGR